MFIDYELTTDLAIIDRVRARYAAERAALAQLGFTELCFYSEIIFPFSAVVLFPAWWMMRQHKEVRQIRWPLRISASYPLLVSPSHATSVLVMGLGVKFYTLFADDTGLITANFNSSSGQDRDGTFVKYATPGSIEAIWQQHGERLREAQASGKQLRAATTFEDYVALSQREENMTADISLHPVKGEAVQLAPANNRVFSRLVFLLLILMMVGLLLIVLLPLILPRARG